MHFFTSITMNYLPKACVLAESVKKHCKNSKFSLVISDKVPEDVTLNKDLFDEVLFVEDLGIPVDNLNLWIFQHAVVELCTAVKGQALLNFLEQGSEKVIYLDPDTAVFDSLDELEKLMDLHPIILTPHQTIPEKKKQDVWNNEVSSLKHGVYNFGFFAVNNTREGLSFARWWRDRLVEFCFDDIPNGLFTDQKWGDLVPAFFENAYILRKPNYNVATWNISNREVKLVDKFKFSVDGLPLQFYHFSGFDSGNQEAMLLLYGKDNPALWELRNWYIEQMNKYGQETLGKMPCYYNVFDNKETITKHQRWTVRSRNDLLDYLANTNPFQTENIRSYYVWYFEAKNDAMDDGLTKDDYIHKYLETKNENIVLRKQIEELVQSNSWKITAWLRKLSKVLKK